MGDTTIQDMLERHRRWRAGERGGKRADSTDANLAGANLAGADLWGARLCGANLHGANLVGANLALAYLDRANLAEANMTGARLVGADLNRSCLTGAILNEANLECASLCGADLWGATLAKAKLNDVSLDGACLTRANFEGVTIGDGLLLIGPRPIIQIGPIGSRRSFFVGYVTNRGLWVKAGCFFGDVVNFRARLALVHDGHKHIDCSNSGKYLEEYSAALDFMKAYAARWRS